MNLMHLKLKYFIFNCPKLNWTKVNTVSLMIYFTFEMLFVATDLISNSEFILTIGEHE